MRIRSLKPEYTTDRITGRWPLEMQMFFAALWCLADDEGRFEWEPDFIRTQLFPYHPTLDAAKCLKFCENFTRIRKYEAGGMTYGVIINFKKHQHPNKPLRSRLPKPPHFETNGELPEDYRSTNGDLLPVVVVVEESRGEESRGEKRCAESSKKLRSPPDASLDWSQELLKAWPDVGKKLPQIELAWPNAFPAVDLLAEVRKAIAWEAANPKYRKKDHLRFMNLWLTRVQEKAGEQFRHGQQTLSVIRPMSSAESHQKDYEDFKAGKELL